MNEIEVKFAVDSFEEIKVKLKDLGFVQNKSFIEKVCYYDSLDNKWKNSNTVIRTKMIEGKIIFTIKKKISGEFKGALEKECEIIGSEEEFKEMLEMIELQPDLEYSKKREHFTRADSSAIELDDVKEIGAKFIELETTSEEKMKVLIEELGFGNLTPDLRGYPKIIRDYRAKK